MSEREPFDPRESLGQLLPKVDYELSGAIMKEIEEQGEEEFMINLMRRIDKENPAIGGFLGIMGKQSKDLKATMGCGALVYELLRRQAEADRMKKEFGE